jgi:hypothetical protein
VPRRAADQGKSIPNGLHGELPHTDPDGRIAGVRSPAQRTNREAWCMIAVRTVAKSVRDFSLNVSGWPSECGQFRNQAAPREATVLIFVDRAHLSWHYLPLISFRA